MIIERLETYRVSIPLKPAYRMVSSLGSHETSDYVLVRLITDTGLEGAGEATVTVRWSGETVWGAQAVIDRVLAPLVVGSDPREIEDIADRMDRICSRNWFAKAAVEMACWDVYGKSEEKPIYELLGGAARDRAVRCRFSLGAYPLDRARRRAAELVAEGFETIKVKVGGPLDQDLPRVRAVRDVIGDRDLVIDANCGWNADTAIEAIGQLRDVNLTLVEQPTADGDYDALARVRRETDVPILADDICFDLVHAQELIRQACCDAISIYPGKNGGIFRSRQIAEFAEQHNVPCSIGSNLELDVATAAMAHLVVGTPNLQVERFPGDMLGPAYHETSVVKNPIEIQGPITTVSDRPGLGVEVDWQRVASLG